MCDISNEPITAFATSESMADFKSCASFERIVRVSADLSGCAGGVLVGGCCNGGVFAGDWLTLLLKKSI